MVYGFVQESIMTANWGPDVKISSLFLVMCNRITSMSIAIIAILIRRETMKPVAPFQSYLVIAFSNMMATTCQYEALRYVSFPTQTLGKTAKMIPVMIWGTFLTKKVYKVKDYIVAGAVTVGTTCFLLLGPVGARKIKEGGEVATDTTSTVIGMLIMVMYLGFDGFTSTWQEKLFKSLDVSTWNQMLYVGFLSTIITSFGQLGAPVPKWDPTLYTYILALSLSAAVAQIFILITIKEFGALLFATVMTTRQFLSILLSCIIFLHPLTWGQWLGTTLVFGALYYKTFAGGGGGKKKNSNVEHQAVPQDDKDVPMVQTNADKTEAEEPAK